MCIRDRTNNVKVKTVWSDLMDNLQDQPFDYVIINPPYYPKNANSDPEKAWYCGENFEYFEKLFLQLAHPMHERSTMIMILSEDCDLENIQKIAGKHNLNCRVFYKEIKNGEENYLFRIEHSVSL